MWSERKGSGAAWVCPEQQNKSEPSNRPLSPTFAKTNSTKIDSRWPIKQKGSLAQSDVGYFFRLFFFTRRHIICINSDWASHTPLLRCAPSFLSREFSMFFPPRRLASNRAHTRCYAVYASCKPEMGGALPSSKTRLFYLLVRTAVH